MMDRALLLQVYGNFGERLASACCGGTDAAACPRAPGRWRLRM